MTIVFSCHIYQHTFIRFMGFAPVSAFVVWCTNLCPQSRTAILHLRGKWLVLIAIRREKTVKGDIVSHTNQNAHCKVNGWSTCAAAARSALASRPLLTWTGRLTHDAPLSRLRQYGALWGRGVHALVHPQFFWPFWVREQCTAYLSVWRHFA